jgi:hypothetical protein
MLCGGGSDFIVKILKLRFFTAHVISMATKCRSSIFFTFFIFEAVWLHEKSAEVFGTRQIGGEKAQSTYGSESVCAPRWKLHLGVSPWEAKVLQIHIPDEQRTDEATDALEVDRMSIFLTEKSPLRCSNPLPTRRWSAIM